MRFNWKSKPHHDTTAASPLMLQLIVEPEPQGLLDNQHCGEPEMVRLVPDVLDARYLLKSPDVTSVQGRSPVKTFPLGQTAMHWSPSGPVPYHAPTSVPPVMPPTPEEPDELPVSPPPQAKVTADAVSRTDEATLERGASISDLHFGVSFITVPSPALVQ